MRVVVGQRGSLALASLLVLLAPAAVSADSFAPVRMTVRVTATARADRPLALAVSVSADPGALDVRQGRVRAQVKLAPGECGGVYAHTAGTVVLDRPLHPQPSPGRAYAGSASGGRRPHRYGVQTVCAFLDDDYQQLASSTDQLQVDVSRACTVAADRLDAYLRRHRRRRPAAHRLRAAARRACGPGVRL